MKKLIPLLVGGIFLLATQTATADGPADNARIDVSAGLVAAVFEKDVDQTDKVNDVIMDNPVHGTARTRAKVSAVLVPDSGNAVIDVMIRGTVVSVTVAVPPEKDLLVYTTTTSPFIVRTRLYINQAGIHSFPTQARVTSSVLLNKITTLKGETDTVGTRFAEAGFEITKPRLEKVSSDAISKSLIEQTDAQFRTQLAQGNTAFTRALQQIKDQGVPLRSYHFSSSNSLLSLGALLMTTPPATPPAPMPPLPRPLDLAGRVHQTAVNDTAQAVLAGKTFDVHDLGNLPGTSNSGARAPRSGQRLASAHDQFVQDCLGPIPRHLGVKSLTVTFADRDPITAQLADHCVALTIRIKQIRAGGLPLPGATIRTVYRIENSPGKVELVRQGPVQIDPFQHAGKHPQAGTLQTGFDEVFGPRIQVPDLHLPAELSQVGTLVPSYGDAVQGWLLLTWVRKK